MYLTRYSFIKWPNLIIDLGRNSFASERLLFGHVQVSAL